MPTAYLISYGSSGLLGRFVPCDERQTFRRADRVIIRSERGKELGTVLAPAEEFVLPTSLKHIPGEILGLAKQTDEHQAKSQFDKSISFFAKARSIVQDLATPIEIVDLEIVADPETYVVHLLRFGEVTLQNIQDALSQTFQTNILLHDVTDPTALDHSEEEKCGSCGSESGCSSKGGCASGACGSGCGSSKEFPDQWKAYFAELREQMELRKKQALLVE